MSNSAVRPSFRVTTVRIDGCGPRFTVATTWLLVMISPSGLRMTPEPNSD